MGLRDYQIANSSVAKFNATDGVVDQITASLLSPTSADPVVPEARRTSMAGLTVLLPKRRRSCSTLTSCISVLSESFVTSNTGRRLNLLTLAHKAVV